MAGMAFHLMVVLRHPVATRPERDRSANPYDPLVTASRNLSSLLGRVTADMYGPGHGEPSSRTSAAARAAQGRAVRRSLRGMRATRRHIGAGWNRCADHESIRGGVDLSEPRGPRGLTRSVFVTGNHPGGASTLAEDGAIVLRNSSRITRTQSNPLVHRANRNEHGADGMQFTPYVEADFAPN